MTTPKLTIDGQVEVPLVLTQQDLAGFDSTEQVVDVSRFHPTRRGDGVTPVEAREGLGSCKIAGRGGYLQGDRSTKCREKYCRIWRFQCWFCVVRVPTWPVIRTPLLSLR